MAARKPFLLRTDPKVLAALRRWAADEMRSVNGQIDFVLRGALRRAGRLPVRAERPAKTETHADEGRAGRPGAE
jgi:hypothetical protein